MFKSEKDISSSMKCILIDLEGVLVSGKRMNYQPWLISLGANPSKVHQVYHKIVGDLHKGRISCSKAVKIINTSLGTAIPTEEFFRHRTQYNFINKQALDFVKKMKDKGIKVYLISDISKYSWRFIKKKYSFLHLFSQRILSFNTGFRKDQPQYYDYLERRLHCKKEDMLLIDDDIKNVSTAIKKGLHTTHFTESMKLNTVKLN